MATVAILIALYFASALAYPEQGKWDLKFNQDHIYRAVSKHMYQGSKVTASVTIKCEDGSTDEIEVTWLLQMGHCAYEFTGTADRFNHDDPKKKDEIEASWDKYMRKPDPQYELADNIQYMIGGLNHSCSDGEKEFKLEGIKGQQPIIIQIHKNTTDTNAKEAPASDNADQGADAADKGKNEGKDKGGDGKVDTTEAKKLTPTPNSRTKRDEQGQSESGNTKDVSKSEPVNTKETSVTEKSNTLRKTDKVDHVDTATVWLDGNYLFIIRIRPKQRSTKFNAQATVRTFYGDENYISALEYPLLIVYGILGLVYIAYGLLWMVLLACNWRDLLRVQFWVCGVILLGMLEKAVFFAEYENINKTGQSVYGAVVFAELVSCLKRALARMLVIIVCLGFGIVKPRLGQAFHKVLFVGGLYFILAAIEGCMRATSATIDDKNQNMIAGVPLAVLEAVICWWIFSSLIQTTRTLRLRRNIVKLTLYRHFTNTLIFAVLASVAYMIWSISQHKVKNCIMDWKQLWVDDAFWHMLFVILLFIIMLLWRPTANNQRYAFSPLLDAADEEDEEDTMMNDAFDGMKMRGVKSSNGSPKQRDPKSKVEDDLKWVEENIPSSVADKTLPSLLDSDEELMTTKFEMSKME